MPGSGHDRAAGDRRDPFRVGAPQPPVRCQLIGSLLAGIRVFLAHAACCRPQAPDQHVSMHYSMILLCMLYTCLLTVRLSSAGSGSLCSSGTNAAALRTPAAGGSSRYGDGARLASRGLSSISPCRAASPTVSSPG